MGCLASVSAAWLIIYGLQLIGIFLYFLATETLPLADSWYTTILSFYFVQVYAIKIYFSHYESIVEDKGLDARNNNAAWMQVITSTLFMLVSICLVIFGGINGVWALMGTQIVISIYAIWLAIGTWGMHKYSSTAGTIHERNLEKIKEGEESVAVSSARYK